MAGLIKKVVGGFAGLAAEAYEHNKAKKERAKSDTAAMEVSSSAAEHSSARTEAPSSYDVATSGRAPSQPYCIDKKTSATLEDNEYSSHSIDEEAFYEKQDEVAWELDEVEDQATTSLELEKSQSSEPSGVDALVQSFIVRHPQPATQHSFQPVPCPVILPQKRPGSRARGFVRAYSPVLQDAGLDQATFLDFLDTFEKSTRHSPVFDVINLACFIGGMIPEPFTQIVTTAVGVANQIGQRVDDRRKTTNFMTAMNSSVFKPRGLFCLIMTYKPSSPSICQRFDFNSPSPFDISQVIGKAAVAPTGMKKYLNLKVSAGSTHEFELPDAAPLVFPAIDNASTEQQSAMKRSGRFVGDYIDRRRQAAWIMENPESKLNMAPKPKFLSAVADPMHPMNSGGLITLVTGGALGGRKRERRAERKDNRCESRMDRANRRDGKRERRFERKMIRRGVDSGDVRGGLLSRPVGLCRGIGVDINRSNDYAARPEATSSRQQEKETPPSPLSSPPPSCSTSDDDEQQIYSTQASSTQQQRPTGLRQCSQRSRGNGGGPLGMMKKIIKEDTLYLMVVNMPSQEEIDVAMERDKQRKNDVVQRGLAMLMQRFDGVMLG